MPLFDLAVIGGGINGTGIARDAAGRGLSVVLIEKSDLASATSSASTKLIHGGLRYLEHYAFRLVRESLMERERLWAIAPHIIWPLRFILPQMPGMRPGWMLRLGLFIYDHLGGREKLPATRTLDLSRDEAGQPLRAGISRGFEYSDLWVEDSRLVVLNARDAAARGAKILTRHEVVSARRREVGTDQVWDIETRNSMTGEQTSIGARLLVNAGGPWAGEVTTGVMGLNTPARIRMVQGSHIVVPRLFVHDRAYIFQNADGRIIFAIPYEQDFTLIGTTDRDYTGDPKLVAISDVEVDYLCNAASEYFRKPIGRETIVWTYSGVRPLYDDGASKAQEATRDYVLHLDNPATGAASLSVYGGKLTTYRRLAEHAMEKLDPYLPERARGQKSWTGAAPLPGGNFPVDGFDKLVADLARRAPFLAPCEARRLARAYGTDASELLGDARTIADCGRSFGGGLTTREIAWLTSREWAMTVDDILWRRSKLGLHLSDAEKAEVASLF
ncbi:GlpA Glycerol-3-phosphate dehydrogenase [Rhabdaerophilaceae bacterium]